VSFDAHKNFAYSTIATAPSPALSGTSLVLQAGDGAKFPAAPFNAVIWPAGAIPLATNAEIVRVTVVATDTLTITRQTETSGNRSVVIGDQIAAAITAKTLTDIEALTTPRTVSVTSSATPTPNADVTDLYDVTALAAGATFGNPTGTPINAQHLLIRIKDNGSAQTLAWDTAYAAGGVALPTTTVISKILVIEFIYNTANALNKWQCVLVAQEGAVPASGPRTVSVTSSATPTPNADVTDLYDVTALAAGATFGNPTGTPLNGQKLIIRIKDNATARALTWGSAYVAGGVALPSTTILSKILTLGFIYNSANALNKWQLVASSQEA
jgi:hypothetical protein